ncbi:MAG: hypothetical protein HXY30_07450 [Pseudorhodoplanes sp.]|nr:hypothetical protein [Pseudorhodoplanes sp.]
MAEDKGLFTIADEQIDMAGLVRLLSWGGAAALALGAVVFATRSEIGASRLAVSPQVSRVDTAAFERAAEAEQETRRLALLVRSVASDRDKLLARVAVLERNLEDVTGSVGRLGKSPASPPQPAPASPATQAGDTGPFGYVGPTTGTTISTALAIGALPATLPSPARAAPPAETQEVADQGVDIGGGANLGSLRDLWHSAATNHAGLFEGLHPIIAVRENAKNVQLRLIAGPMTGSAAARLCAALAGSGLTCKPVPYDGQRLAAR